MKVAERVTHENSTVLGYTAQWAWDHLCYWNHARSDTSWSDESGFEYLHVPAWNPLDGPLPKFRSRGVLMWYRVRPRWLTTRSYYKRHWKVLNVFARRVRGVWHWELSLEPR